MEHPVDALFAAMVEVEPYPDGVMGFPTRLSRTAFFPGGMGLWRESSEVDIPPMPIGGVMVLGHDFHSEAAFARSVAAGSEEALAPTWRVLTAVLQTARIELRDCFFTNAYMGLRRGNATTGRFPGSRNPDFVQRCQRFLLRQIGVQQPRLILTLGKWVPRFIAPLSPQLTRWKRAETFAAIDAVSPVVPGVVFEGIEVPRCTVVALTHPCLRGPNVRRRRFQSYIGDEAEIAMLRAAQSIGEG